MNSKTRKTGIFNLLKGVMIVFFITSIQLIPVSSAFAHKVYIFAWIEGHTVRTDSYFSKDKKVRDGIIRVFDKDKEILQGTTNENGEFSFAIPGNISNTGLKLVLESSMGHKAECLLTGDEFPGYQDEKGQAMEDTDNEISSSPEIKADMKAIREMMEEILDARLNPISRSLARIQEEKGPGFTEVAGGIGYIVGIMGIALYVKNRKK
jgi:nickel transport protein